MFMERDMHYLDYNIIFFYLTQNQNSKKNANNINDSIKK